MENFTNEPIDISALPRYEAVNLNALQPKYWNVILFNIVATFLIIGVVLAVIVYFVEEIHSIAWLFGLVYVLFLIFKQVINIIFSNFLIIYLIYLQQYYI